MERERLCLAANFELPQLETRTGEGRGDRRKLRAAWMNKSVNDCFLFPKKEIPQGNSLAKCLLNHEEEVEKYLSCDFSEGKMTAHVESDNTGRLG